ncbi:MAG: NADH-ubiquinone oxidoreductase-F iron-sulfur binding region domain-containing protein [Ignavibacteria bacterium]|nr:NADH-ubiquinone oxidoreductase-F iron-sulfur binding region domain-containing protein [Ignavibacteria bacterium]
MAIERMHSIGDFRTLQQRLTAESGPHIPVIVIPAGTCGQASGANDLIRIAKRDILSRGLSEKVRLRVTGCHGYCQMEPSILIKPRGTFYPRVNVSQMSEIVDAVTSGKVLDHLLFRDPETGAHIEKQCDVPFFKRQTRSILAQNECVDPIRISNYIESGGYGALIKALEQADPVWAIEEVKNSGLRGRGGTGFPTGLKWELLSKQNGTRGKFLVCNADEGDPGAYMDRSVLEGNPHSVIEGMLIGAFATGATQGIFYVRNEYPLAIKHLLIALRQALELGLLGQNILGTGLSFDVELVKGAGAFVCGEETALIRSIEGKVGEPRQRPPFPVQKGIEGKPTAINNVETWANIPIVLRIGGEEFAKIGTRKNSGTKIFSLVGKVKNTGLVEVPMGVTINTIVHTVGSGPAGKARIKAVQTGGPSGGCIPSSMFDLPIDYDSLVAAGSIMGSGGMIVMDENTCMVDLAKYFMRFLKDESCGKCFTCRKGTQRLYEILEDISNGRGTDNHVELLEELAQVVKDTSMCGLGQSAPNPVLSTLRYFKNEYKRHIHDKRCDAFVCKGIVGAPCASACPVGTEAWRYIAHIQRGEYEQAYNVIREANPFPSVCARVCNHPCEVRCKAGTQGGEAIAIRALKRFITDRSDPLSFKPVRTTDDVAATQRIAIVGSGPAGLAAAHYLSLKGYKSSIFESDARPGGMLYSAIPAYRLPRKTIEKEIESILDENITVKCGTTLGSDITIDSLLDEGYNAVFLAFGAHKSLRLRLRGEDLPGVYPSIQYLKGFNQRGENLAKGRVGIVGGGNSAVDAARVAIRQPDVKGVTLYYRRTREEMPAFEEEIEAAIQEGVHLETLVAPTGILEEDGMLSAIEFINNQLGDFDESGRRRPVPIPGTQHIVPLDTLIVAISEGSDTDCLSVAGVNRVDVDERAGTIRIDPETLCTNRPGVFAGGDVVTGPNTVIDAVAAGKKAAVVIDRYLRGQPLKQPSELRLPHHYVEPTNGHAIPRTQRVDVPRVGMDTRKHQFMEVELTLSEQDAKLEAARCLRCDLEFTRPLKQEPAVEEQKEQFA